MISQPSKHPEQGTAAEIDPGPLLQAACGNAVKGIGTNNLAWFHRLPRAQLVDSLPVIPATQTGSIGPT
jgi:hypothetical protein